MKRFRRNRNGKNGGPAPGANRGVYGFVAFLAGLIDIVVGIVCLLILAGILIVVLGANQDNAIVGWLHDAAKFLAGPFADIFQRDDRKEEVAINWGIAIVVYFVIGRVISALLRRGSAKR